MPFHHYTGFTLHEMGLVLGMNNRHEDSMYVSPGMINVQYV